MLSAYFHCHILNMDQQPSENQSNSAKKEIPESLEIKLDKLYNKLSEKKKRDGWEIFQIIGSTSATILIAGVGLYFTTTYNYENLAQQTKNQVAQQESQRLQLEIQRSQLQLQEAQYKIAELKAITDLTPFLANKDTLIRFYANRGLQLFVKSNRSPFPERTTSKLSSVQKTTMPVQHENNFVDMVDELTLIALSSPGNKGSNATEKIIKIYRDENLSKVLRQKALRSVSKIAEAANAPFDSKRLAANFLNSIRSVPYDKIGSEIANDTCTRPVNEFVLHHTFIPSIEGYKKDQTFKSISRFQLETLGWQTPGSQYTISPDGLIWPGTKLGVVPIGIPGHTKGTVSITLIMNGDIELPTDEQKKALVRVLEALSKKFNVQLKENFSNAKGLHSDYSKMKSCPGKLITHELVLQWINEYR